MNTQSQIQADAAVDAPAKVVKAIADTANKAANDTAKAAKTAKRSTAAKRGAAKRSTKRAKPAVATARKARRSKTVRTPRTAARKPAAAAFATRTPTMNSIPNLFEGFNAFTGNSPFQAMFTQTGERGQEAVKKSQTVAQELTDLARANVEAIVEAGRLASEGARSIGQDAVARTREGAEQAADAIRSLTEAKSPTEFVQLQSELARTSFDRLVTETSRWTESMVKLAGKAVQPLSKRATANAERINNIVA
ncbi:MAG: phasin family protein [Sphingomicrobium sp.]